MQGDPGLLYPLAKPGEPVRLLAHAVALAFCVAAPAAAEFAESLAPPPPALACLRPPGAGRSVVVPVEDALLPTAAVGLMAAEVREALP